MSSWSAIRRRSNAPAMVHPHLRMAILQRGPLEDALWFFKELSMDQVDVAAAVLAERLHKALQENAPMLELVRDSKRLAYGQLVQQLLYARQQRLAFVPQLSELASRRL